LMLPVFGSPAVVGRTDGAAGTTVAVPLVDLRLGGLVGTSGSSDGAVLTIISSNGVPPSVLHVRKVAVPSRHTSTPAPAEKSKRACRTRHGGRGRGASRPKDRLADASGISCGASVLSLVVTFGSVCMFSCTYKTNRVHNGYCVYCDLKHRYLPPAIDCSRGGYRTVKLLFL